MKILIDNGHGIDTKGKRSPDGRLLEYRENRIIARGIVDALTARGLDASLLVLLSEKEAKYGRFLFSRSR